MFAISPVVEIHWRSRRPRNSEWLELQGWTFLPLNREWDAIERDLIMAATGLGAVSPEYGCLAPHRWWVAFLQAFRKHRDPIRSATEVEHPRRSMDAMAATIDEIEPRDWDRRPGSCGGNSRLDGTWETIAPPSQVGTLDSPSAWMKMELLEIEGRGVAVTRSGRGGGAWVWEGSQWLWAPGLANKEGALMSAQDFRQEFPDADIAGIIRIATRHASTETS